MYETNLMYELFHKKSKEGHIMHYKKYRNCGNTYVLHFRKLMMNSLKEHEMDSLQSCFQINHSSVFVVF